MCVRLFKIKSKSDYAQKFAFVPCGVCEECRESLKNQWSFRLRTELEYCRQRKWNVGFFTLTYNDAHLPHIPYQAFYEQKLPQDVNGNPVFPAVPCFSRYDVRTFIDNIRKRLNERYGLSGNSRIRYLIACEYGSHTKRPHMHGLVCFPCNVPPNEVFSLIKRNWHNGFVFPKDIRGGVDSHGYKHKPFLLQGDVAGAAVYASKYCCKDLDYYESIKGYDLDKAAVKDCMPFHIQSRSIGLQYFQNKDAAGLLDALKNGESFKGSLKRLPLPLYIKKKILYTPHYTFEPSKIGDWWYDFEFDKWRYKKGQGTHKRCVGQKALDFFKENLNEVFSQKVEYYRSLFVDMKSVDFWTTKKLSFDTSKRFASIAERLEVSTGLTAERLAIGYMSYYGVPYERCKAVSPELFYLSRYCPDMDLEKCPPLNETYYRNIRVYIGFLIDCLRFVVTKDVDKRKRISRIIDKYKSLT